MPKLKPDFYLQENVLSLAQQLLGKVLYTHIDGVVTSGKIVETEAYNGREGTEIWIQDEGISVQASEIIASPRVGVAYAAEHALLPWRYSIKLNPFVSKPKPEKSI